jgi:hypothetical protein
MYLVRRQTVPTVPCEKAESTYCPCEKAGGTYLVPYEKEGKTYSTVSEGRQCLLDNVRRKPVPTVLGEKASSTYCSK